MLRIAVPNKGSLSDPAITMLSEAGYRTRRTGRELVLVDEANDVELFFLRPRDIAVYVGQGTVHAGITGRDLLLDSGVDAVEHLPLGFARSTFRFATPTGTMTSIADVVETGSTLRAAGLEVFGEPILTSEAVLITTEQHRDAPGLATLVRRLEGVLRARSYVLVDYDVPMSRLHLAAALTPGIESPTVSPLQNPDWVAVRAMVPRADMNRVMDELYEVGARAILVSSLLACRL